MTTAMQGNVATERKLDIGAGWVKQPGWESIDRSAVSAPDYVHDITQLPWPFEDGAFDELRCSHILEHIDRSLLVSVMNEMHRVLRTGGRAYIEVPVAPHWKAFADPTHVSFLVPQTFSYFADPNLAPFRTLYGIRPWAYRPEDIVAEGYQFGTDNDGIIWLWLIKLEGEP